MSEPVGRTPDTVDDLRERARAEGVAGAAQLRKDELVEAMFEAHRTGARRAPEDGAEAADPDGT